MKNYSSRLKEFLKSKFFIIMLSIAIFLTLVPATLASMGRVDILKSAANFVAVPFRKFSDFCGRSFKGFTDYFTEFDKLKAENESLKNQLESLQNENDSANVALEENKWLRDFVLFVNENPDMKLIDAVTVSKDNSDYITSFTLNKGTISGVKVNMAVMNEKGIIGYVSEVGLNYCKVTTLITDSTKVGVFCERSSVYGELYGNYSYLKNGLCKMIVDSETADIQKGDVICTSGKGSVYPFGILVGRVTKVEKDPYSRNVVAYIKPNVDFSKIDRVMVILSFGGNEDENS